MKKESDLYYFYLETVKIFQKSEIFRKIPEIADDHLIISESKPKT